MATLNSIEDYYARLGVDRTATPEVITRAYRRLVLQLRPDRDGYSQALQWLVTAHDTLSNENKRREYDYIYTLIRQGQTYPQFPQTPRQSPDSASQSGVGNYADQIEQANGHMARVEWLDQQSNFQTQTSEEMAQVVTEQPKMLREKLEAGEQEHLRPQQRRATNFYTGEDHDRTLQARAWACDHEGEWIKVPGAALCPERQDLWEHMLRCPSCEMQACMRCHRELLTRFPNKTARMASTQGLWYPGIREKPVYGY